MQPLLSKASQTLGLMCACLDKASQALCMLFYIKHLGVVWFCRAEEDLAPGATGPAKRVAVKQVRGIHHPHVAQWVQQENAMLRTLADKSYTVEYHGMFEGEMFESGKSVPCAYLVMG